MTAMADEGLSYREKSQYCPRCGRVLWGTGPDPTLVSRQIDFCSCDEKKQPQCKFCGRMMGDVMRGWTISSNGNECPSCKAVKL